MNKINKFEDLKCWEEARNFTSKIYKLTKKIASKKDYRLIDQITRASLSIMNNIAEGYSSKSVKEFIRFLHYSRRSCGEAQNCLYVTLDQNYINKIEFQELYDQAVEIRKIIDGLIRYLMKKIPDKTKSLNY